MIDISLNSNESKEIHRLLNRIEIPSELLLQHLANPKNNPILHEKLAPLINYTKRHHPKQLYKLRTYSPNSINALVEGKLFLSRADYFNDPYDCALYFNPLDVRRVIESHISEENMCDYLVKSGASEEIAQMILGWLHTEKDLCVNQVSERFPSVANQLQTSSFVACLTENVKSPVMWAHYADEHKGFAIEYQFDSDYYYPRPMILCDDEYQLCGWRSLLPVLYTKNRPNGEALADWYSLCEMHKQFQPQWKESDIIGTLSDSLLHTKYNLQKATEWNYEKEWRYMITHHWPHQVGNPTVHVMADAKAIYLGVRMLEADRINLAQIAKTKNIPIYEMFIDYTSSSYEMEWRPYSV